MRSELENIERIEKYLRNELSTEDMQAFDEQLKTDSTLKSQVEVQKDIVEGIQRLSVKQSIQKAFSTYKMRRNFFRFGLGSLFALGIVSAALWASDSIETENSVAKIEETSTPQSRSAVQVGPEFMISEEFMAEIQSFEIDPTIKTSLKIGKEGTVLHIPKSAFVDQEGKAITSTVTITYQEFKNPADMAFSGIPMTYTNRDVEYNFNSSGMFSIKGYSDGEEIKVNPAKSLSIDYALAKQNADIDFYRLKDDSTNWEFLEEIDELTALEQDFTDSIPEGNFGFGIAAEPTVQQVNGTAQLLLAKDNAEGNTNVAPTTTLGNPVTEKTIFQYNIEMGVDSVQAQKNADRYVESVAGHTYPPIISGLRINSFGVYNCDAIYRLRNRVTVQPTYLDENGDEIKEQKMVSLIDLNVNSAFSFGPRSFTCNPKANNLILLFTTSNELYLLEKGNFGKSPIANNGSSSYQMKNVTETITNSNDLKAYLVP
ncbi:MAG: hypothetical protein ACJASQ_000071 [Crocinitomicaceae bacterium]|jgi:hypothetical protein